MIAPVGVVGFLGQEIVEPFQGTKQFGAGVTACIVCSGSKHGGDVAIDDVVIGAGDGDGLGCIPVGCREGVGIGA